MSENNGPFKGQCLCGAIRYAIDEMPPDITHCHCSMCRKFHGAAFATFGLVRGEKFHWLAGKELLKTYVAPNGATRQFCEKCGSSMIFISAKGTGKFVEFALGTLDAGTGCKPDAHIYTGSKADWYEISDELPQFSEGRDVEE